MGLDNVGKTLPWIGEGAYSNELSLLRSCNILDHHRLGNLDSLPTRPLNCGYYRDRSGGAKSDCFPTTCLLRAASNLTEQARLQAWCLLKQLEHCIHVPLAFLINLPCHSGGESWHMSLEGVGAHISLVKGAGWGSLQDDRDLPCQGLPSLRAWNPQNHDQKAKEIIFPVIKSQCYYAHLIPISELLHFL